MLDHLRYVVLFSFLSLFVLKIGVEVALLFFIISGFAGFHLFEIELIFRQLLDSPQTRLSFQHIKAATSEQSSSLISQRLLFPIYLFVALLIVTSTGSLIGTGFILGLGVRFVWDFIYLNDQPERLYRQYLIHVLPSADGKKISYIRWGFMLLFSLLSILVLW